MDQLRGGAGIGTMHAICQTSFDNPNARMCNTKEFIDSPNITTITSEDPAASWIHPFVMSAGGDYSGGYQADRSCLGWSVTDINVDGVAVVVNESGRISFESRACTAVLPVTCCAPSP